eukprot:s2941_g18.t1
MRVEMNAWLCMCARYKQKAWLHGLTPAPFNKFVDFILGDKVYNVHGPSLSGDGHTRVKPDWGIILSFEHRLRKEAFRLVTRDGMTLAAALDSVIHDAELKETYFTTPVALRTAMSAQADPPQAKWQRPNNKGFGKAASFKGKGKSGKGKGKEVRKELQGLSLAWRTPDNRELCFSFNSGSCDGKCNRVHQCRVKGCYGDHPAIKHKEIVGSGFPWLSHENAKIVEEANNFILQCLKACTLVVECNGWFFWEHPEDLGVVQDEVPGSIWQWDEVHELIAFASGCTFAVHQCHFGALTSKPTRFMCNFHISDKRCFYGLPKFDKKIRYLGPLPLSCGHRHTHRLMGKTANRWNTSPSASYPEGLCKFITEAILVAHTTCGGGSKAGLKAAKSLRVATNINTPTAHSSSAAKVVSSGDHPTRNTPHSGGDGAVPVQVDSDSEDAHTVQEASVLQADEFDVHSCLNRGHPMRVEWDGRERDFIDGFGLCSPTRWHPASRGVRRTAEMKKLACDTFAILLEGVNSCIPDVRTEAFRLATGKLAQSPFPESVLWDLRRRWAKLLPDPEGALTVAEGQPFLLHGLAQWLEIFGDPDVSSLVDVKDSFAEGVPVGVLEPLPRSPQVFPPKLKHKRLDDSDFNPIALNYPSAKVSAAELEKKFLEEEALGRMFPLRLSVAKERFGEDKVAAAVRESLETREAPFAVSADIKSAHRLVKLRSSDWGFVACRSDSDSQTIWLNKCGTFGISSAPYWWAKLFALVGRFVGHLMTTVWFLHMVYVDDLHSVFTGERKFHNMWVWVLAFELIGTPFGYHKFKGGFAVEFVGFQMRYDTKEVGVTLRRGDWLRDWIVSAASKRYVVVTRDFAEFLGRLGFVSQLLVWIKPHLSPLYAWSAATGSSTVAKLPDTVILTLRYILAELEVESYLVSAARPRYFSGEQFRTDAKCTDDLVVLGGWEVQTGRWFQVNITCNDAPYLFSGGKGSQWASTSAELLASMAGLVAFGWSAQERVRKSWAQV